MSILTSVNENSNREDIRKFCKTDWNGQVDIVDVEKIVSVEAYRHHTMIHLEDKCLECKHSLKYFHSLLTDSEFVRCHNSILVNLKYVRSLQENDLISSTGKRIEISVRKKKDCVKALNRYMADKIIQ